MSTARVSLPLLDQIQIASPCSADWEQMHGDDRQRFCQQCSLHVYDLSTMTTHDAEAFLQAGRRSGERTCVRFFRRADGRVLTQDCPVGLRRIRLRALRTIAAFATFLVAGLAVAAAGTRLSGWAQRFHQSSIDMLGRIAVPSPPAGNPNPAMGDMAIMGGMVCPQDDPQVFPVDPSLPQSK